MPKRADGDNKTQYGSARIAAELTASEFDAPATSITTGLIRPLTFITYV